VYLGLTGGIGSGKTTVADMFAQYGAYVLRADEFAKAALEPHSPLLPDLIDAFGANIAPSGIVNRQALADIVFNNDIARQRLEGLVHPEVARRLRSAREALPQDAMVVYDVPLLAEKNMADQFDVVVVVEAPLDVRVARLISRGMSHEDALARIAHQASDTQRRAVADYIIDNSGSLADLTGEASRVWSAITA